MTIPIGKTSDIPKRTSKKRTSISVVSRKKVLSIHLGIGSTQINNIDFDFDSDLDKKMSGKKEIENAVEYKNLKDPSLTNKSSAPQTAEHLLKMIQINKDAFDKFVLQKNTEFDARNCYLQNLSVELMDKEEMLLKKRILLDTQELELLSQIG